MRRIAFQGALLALVVGGLSALAAQAPPSPPPSHARTIAATAGDLHQLREVDRRIEALRRADVLTPRTVRADTVAGDRLHERYDQRVNGVRVFGGDIARQVRGGVTESVFGTLYEGIQIDTVPTVSEGQAREAFGRLEGTPLPAIRRLELVVLPKDDGGFALTWRTHVWASGGWMHTFLDAHTGEVVLQYNDLQTQSAVGTGTGVLGDQKKISVSAASGRFWADDRLRPPSLVTYDAKGSFDRAFFILFRGLVPTGEDVANDGDNIWTDGANTDAHVHLGWTYDYLFKRFGRKGLDDRDVAIRSLTHPVRRSDVFSASPELLFNYYTNAFWCRGCGHEGVGMMVFGEGLPPDLVLTATRQSWDYTSGALDVVAHELTHALTDYSSQLVYRNESGALNEAFSDMLGASIEFFYQTPGSGPRQADYLIGEDIVTPGGLRSMASPNVFGDPDHYSRRRVGSSDNGFVHTNSSIPNHAFYLAIEGGTNRTSGLSVQGVGAANREQIEKVFYRAFAFMLTSSATFHHARVATIQSARDLYGAASAAERAVTEAWTAVGVN